MASKYPAICIAQASRQDEIQIGSCISLFYFFLTKRWNIASAGPSVIYSTVLQTVKTIDKQGFLKLDFSNEETTKNKWSMW